MLGLNVSDFSWWLWLLTGVGAFIAVIEVMGVSCRRKYEAMKVLLSVVLGLAALVCIAIGFRHFVLWAAGG
jgi:hypothetical protein